MHAPTAEQARFFREILLPTYREFEAALYAYMTGSASEQELRRRFMLSAWSTDYFTVLVTAGDPCKLLALEHTELGLRILRRVMREMEYAKLRISVRSLGSDDALEEPMLSDLLKSIPQLRGMVNIADQGANPDVQEVDLFACLGACIEFWRNAMPDGYEN